ncbi:PX-SNX-like domain protein (macronuclear) [Tetrahymena thermophila SB210]|uniref:PX-SNX-like domain protein n=1 Tax=Tetrahymena thermophila (strain SB210) TaxID=312017 RepID=I7MLF2_TETTS|nr:PX-SNX-like domain protein [Tetrahymena thermophila SB210]EAS01984.2 PX-SNX-like domain protein [Tetrahymena thermophila SB210]|eukprot:XP_001022229.2 PX-SNX-like domain protein [Tetrahymena thermophila SB210]
MSQQALRKVQSFNDMPPSSSDRKSTRNSKSDSVKSHEDKNSSSNSSTDQEAEKKLEFYTNIYARKTILKVNIDNTELVILDNEQYTAYQIKVETDMGTYHINKRYSEFRLFRKELKQQYSDLVIAKFPRKKIFSSFKQKTIENRTKALNDFLAAMFEAYQKKQIFMFLDFIEIQEQFIKKGIHDFFRVQANSAFQIPPQIINSIPIKPTNEQERMMLEIIQKLNAFTDSITCSLEKIRNFYFKQQPTLNRNFIPLILIGQDNLKGIIELSLQVTKENPDSHLICCQGLKLVLELMDIQKNPNAQQFIDVYTKITFQDMKKFNFKAHIANKNAKECKISALKLMKIFVDANSKTLTKSTRQLLMDEKTFEEYVKYFKTQNVPRQLITKAMELAEQDQNPEYASSNYQSINSMRISTQKNSKNWKDILFFNRNSVIDQNSKTFTEPSYSQNCQDETCDLEDLKEAIDEPSIQWTKVYNAEDSFSLQYCKQPDQYILITFFLPLSLSGAQAAVIDNRKDWDTLFMENKKVNLNNYTNEDTYKESLFIQRYNGNRLLTFIYKRTVIEENDSVYIYKEPTQNVEYKPQHYEDLGKWYQLVKFSPYKHEHKLKRFDNTTDSCTTFSIEDDEDDSKSFETLSQNESPITKVDIIIKCCDKNSIVYTTPFLVKDNKQVVDNILNLIESTNKQNSGKSTFDQSLNESITPTTPKRSDS